MNQKNYPKSDVIWDGFWKALGAIAGGFRAQVGARVKAKLAPKSKELGHQDDIKKSSKKCFFKFFKYRSLGSLGPFGAPWGAPGPPKIQFYIKLHYLYF